MHDSGGAVAEPREAASRLADGRCTGSADAVVDRLAREMLRDLLDTAIVRAELSRLRRPRGPSLDREPSMPMQSLSGFDAGRAS